MRSQDTIAQMSSIAQGMLGKQLTYEELVR